MGSVNRTALALGSLLNNDSYRIEAVLGADATSPTGRGGFGITYRALDQNLMRMVAIKEFFPVECRRYGTNLVPDGTWDAQELADSLQKFLEEGRTLARLSHPGIVRVHTIFRENATVYLVMEYLHGETLQQKLRSAPGNRLSTSEALGYIEQAGNALMAVHGGGLLHRDIKPDNLFVRTDGGLVLIDFGSARPMTQDGQFRSEYAIVSEGYSPPENYDYEGHRDDRSDIYSLAATLYHLLTGLVPTAPIRRAAGHPLIPPHVISSDVSKEVSKGILKGLELVPGSRPASIELFLRSLRPPVSAPVLARGQNPVVVDTPRPVAPSPSIVIQGQSLLGIEMVPIPAGEFLMGDDDSFGDRNPRHTVYLDAYYIGKYPVTVKQYFAFVRATGHREPSKPSWGWKEDHPVVGVSWDDAMAYCGWLSQKTGRKVTLPSEAQWERAARGTDGRKYPWGNDWDASRLHCSKQNYGDAKSTVPVGSYPSGASPYGVLDMSGNVWEWCLDWYDADFVKRSSKNNPINNTNGNNRVMRGGSWDDDNPDSFRSSIRYINIPAFRINFIGFRVVSEP